MKSTKFGRKLKELREKKEYTQSQLALMMSMNLRQIQNYESGSVPRMDKLKILSRLLEFDFIGFINKEEVYGGNILEDEYPGYQTAFKSQQTTIETLQQMIEQQIERIKEKEKLLREKDEIIKDLEAKLGKTGGRRSA